jgi:CRISPR/Cas system CSM-associated protein Csm2 small subunit
MIQDLGCIQLENEEAIRYASSWARDGLPTAEKYRKITRMTGQSESTPARDMNYMEFNMIITALAIQLVKDDLRRNKDDGALEVVEALMVKMVDDDSHRSVLEKLLHDTQGPRSFLEQLYYRGVIDGVTKTGTGAKAINILKVAENLFDARVSIAREASKLLSLQSLQNRHYYKMIKDYGGFQRLGMSNTPKMKFIDLDARARDEQHESDLKLNAATAPVDTQMPSRESDKGEEGAQETAEDSSSYSNSSGPMMM